MKRTKTFLLVTTAIFISVFASAQDSTLLRQLPEKYFEQVSAKASQLEEKLDKKSQEAIEKFVKEEQKLRKKLARLDSVAAKNIFTDTEAKYKQLEEKLKQTKKLTQYVPSLDTLTTALKFLEQIQPGAQKLKEAIGKVSGLGTSLQKAEEIKKFIKERKQYLKEQLGKFGFAKELKRLNKQVYYYQQQIAEYKEILKDKKKIERKALELLSKTEIFEKFMRENSLLAGMFRMPGNGDPSSAAYQANLAGLQTRAQVTQMIQQQIAAGGPDAMQQVQQNIQNAQSQLQELKTRVLNAGGGSSDMEMPDFKPNSQKTKSFLKRIEYTANMQSQKATGFFPTTSDIGLSVGYRLNDKSIIGAGVSYKIGWGRGWDDIRITHQGIGLRSFVDIKIKGSIWISGGYEQNYRSAFQNIDQLSDYSAWQTSGLLGVSKVVSMKSKMFKKVKFQLLWDFMSYQQIPRTQPLIYRVGYNF